jgi:hypothetical protein
VRDESVFLCRKIRSPASQFFLGGRLAGCWFQKTWMLLCLVPGLATASSLLFLLCDPAVRVRLHSGDPVGLCRPLHAGCSSLDPSVEQPLNAKMLAKCNLAGGGVGSTHRDPVLLFATTCVQYAARLDVGPSFVVEAADVPSSAMRCKQLSFQAALVCCTASERDLRGNCREQPKGSGPVHDQLLSPCGRKAKPMCLALNLLLRAVVERMIFTYIILACTNRQYRLPWQPRRLASAWCVVVVVADLRKVFECHIGRKLQVRS